jgi:uncharacterized protein YutD
MTLLTWYQKNLYTTLNSSFNTKMNSILKDSRIVESLEKSYKKLNSKFYFTSSKRENNKKKILENMKETVKESISLGSDYYLFNLAIKVRNILSFLNNVPDTNINKQNMLTELAKLQEKWGLENLARVTDQNLCTDKYTVL